MSALQVEGIEFAVAATPEELTQRVSNAVPLAVLVNRDHTDVFFQLFAQHRLIEVREFARHESVDSLHVHVRGLIGAIRRFHELQAAESVAWSEIAGDDVISTDFFGQAILEIFACRTKKEIEKQLREVLERIGAIAELAIFTDPPMAPLSDLGKFQLAVPLQNGGILEAHAYVAFPKYAGEEAERIASRVAGALLGLADSVALAIARNRVLESSLARVHLWESSFEAVADPIVLVSADAKIRRSNSAFAKLLGHNKAVVGEPLRIFPEAELAQMLRFQISEYEYQWGTSFYRVFVSRVSAGLEANGILFRFRDETRERALRDRIRARKQAVDLGILIGSVAHEINNPIGGILIYAQMLLASEELPPEQRQDIRAIEDSAKRIKQIVQTMLALVRRSDGKKVAVSLPNCLDEVLNLLEPELRRAKGRVLREYAVATPTKDLFLVRNSVLQMLFHLLQEVIQRSATTSESASGVDIEIKILDSERELILEINDSGPAISQIAESSVAVSVVRLLLEEQDARLESLRAGERNQLRLSFRRDIVL